MTVTTLTIDCPDCEQPVEVTLTMRAIRCNCQPRDHSHVITHHNAAGALDLHRAGNECL